ncbi:MAG: caspase family protein, partial [Xanthobacteraceae bacterium]
MIATIAAFGNLGPPGVRAPANRGNRGMTGLRSRFLLLFALLCLTVAAPAHAEKRVALVIGNSAYKSAAPLDNPKNDARLMADTLKEAGFVLVGGGAQIDLDGAQFRDAVKEFGKSLQDADVGLFYYAGHGIQVRGSNYLVPIDANSIKEADVDLDMIDTDVVLRQMQGGGTNLNIIILDACRNDPFGGRSLAFGRGRDTVQLRGPNTQNGLAEMKAPAGTLIAFATQPGSAAQDGAEANSPFTRALAEDIRKPGLSLYDTFRMVQENVYRVTHTAQLPYFSTNLIPEFYFIPPTDADDSRARASPAPPVVVGPGEAERLWGYVKDTTSQEVLEEFIRRFGDTFYGALAREKLEELKKKTA